MIKAILFFNVVVLAWFGVELTQYYGQNTFISDFTTGFIVHDAFLPVIISLLNTVAILALGFNIKEKK